MHTTIVFLALAVMPGQAPALIEPASPRLAFNETAEIANSANSISELPPPATSGAEGMMAMPPTMPFDGGPSMAAEPIADATYESPMAGAGGECCEPEYRHHKLCGWHHGSNPDTMKRHLAHCHLSTGDMYPYQPYFPVYHGNYYFRPYYWAHILRDQEISGRYGANPRAPYSSCDLFDKVYMELGVPGPDHYEEVPLPHDRTLPSSHFEGK